MLPKLQDASELLRRIQNLFSDDDITVIRFLRHSYSHPTLNSYIPDIYNDEADVSKPAKWVFDDRKYKLITAALSRMRVTGEAYKLEIGNRFLPFASDLESLAQLCEDLTYRFSKYKHEIFEPWFRE